MSSDTPEISSNDNVSLVIVIVILLFIGGSCSCVPSINHCIEPTGPIREIQVNVDVDPRNLAVFRGSMILQEKKVCVSVCACLFIYGIVWSVAMCMHKSEV